MRNENTEITHATQSARDVPIPERMRRLRIDPDRPYFHVPWFVAWINGKPDYRVIERGRIQDAIRGQVCWLCGQKLGSIQAFVIGPMCAINHVSSEPPSHRSCAEYAVQVCPFLTQPRMRRNEKGIPEERNEAPGFAIMRNPGVSLVWGTTKWSTFRAHAGGDGILFNVGEPYNYSWWAEGRLASRAEVLASIESGLPILQDIAAKDPQPGAIEHLDRELAKALKLLPPEAV